MEVKAFAPIKIAATTASLIRAYNLQHVRVPDSRNTKYDTSVGAQPYTAPDPALYNSTLGTPIFCDVTLKGGQYTDNVTGKVVSFPEIRFETILVTIDFAARIVKTDIQGRNGTIKEYIGEDDAKISFQGIICGSNGHYPALEVSKLNEWRKAPIAKGVVSTYLQNLGISDIVVEDISLPQIAGGYSYQTFTINCISDYPIEAKSIDAKTIFL